MLASAGLPAHCIESWVTQLTMQDAESPGEADKPLSKQQDEPQLNWMLLLPSTQQQSAIPLERWWQCSVADLLAQAGHSARA